MIGRIVAYARTAREAPPTLLDPIIGALAIAAGGYLMRRWISYQRAQVTDGIAELSSLLVTAYKLGGELGEAGAAYPAQEDLDPLNRGELAHAAATSRRPPPRASATAPPAAAG